MRYFIISDIKFLSRASLLYDTRLRKINTGNTGKAYRIIENHVRDKNSLLEITDVVCAMERAVEIKLLTKRPLRKKKKKRKLKKT